MKYFIFCVALSLTGAMIFALSSGFGQTPPIINLLDPNHGIWQNTYSEDYKIDKEIYLRGLTADLTVHYDENLIPHIYAQNEEDLYRAQGYITAQHRLWQMEFQTMAAAGRVSEIVGEQALDFDRMQRRKGLGFGAEAGLKELLESDPQGLRWIEAYTNGVNQFIGSLDFSELPVEYKLLNYQPEPWTPYKTVLLLKYMADMLVGDKDLEYTNMRSIIGEDWMDQLYPDYPKEVDPIIEKERNWDFTPLDIKHPENIIYPDETILVDPIPVPEPGVGSNNWAVSGTKTKNGKPILANDPHLGLNLPSLWFAMQLSTPNYSVKGATLPGALGVISGFNENIAWGVTNATRDVRDWYSITFREDNRTEYLYDGEWKKTSLRLEEIRIKGRPAFVDSVIYTHYGPIVYDRNFRSEYQTANFALKWTAHLPSNEQRTFLELNSATNHDEYIKALNYFTSPAQNFVFASSTGDIAMKVQGRFPLKWEQQGKYLLDGENSAFEWQGFIPFDQNPNTLNPSRGFVSSANQHSVDASYPYYVFDYSFEHYRNRRINNRLASMSDITLQDMMDLQFDNYHLHASEALPTMLAYVQGDPASIKDQRDRDIIQDLEEWDYHTHPDQTEPPLFELWWKNFEDLAWGKWRIKGQPTVLPNKYQTTRLMAEEPGHAAFNNSETDRNENAVMLVKESFVKMVEDYEKWREGTDDYSWSNYKKTSILHLVPNFKSFSVANVPTGGGRGIVNATSERHGASWRMVVEMGEKVTAFGIYPGGQSGNPGSKYYANFIDKWARGEYLSFDLRRLEDENNLLFKTIFKADN